MYKNDIACLRQGQRETLGQVYQEGETSRKCWHMITLCVHFVSGCAFLALHMHAQYKRHSSFVTMMFIYLFLFLVQIMFPVLIPACWDGQTQFARTQCRVLYCWQIQTESWVLIGHGIREGCGTEKERTENRQDWTQFKFWRFQNESEWVAQWVWCFSNWKVQLLKIAVH